jgi:hypothetical protein
MKSDTQNEVVADHAADTIDRLTAGPTASGHSSTGTPEAKLYIYKTPNKRADKIGTKLLLAATFAAGLSIAVGTIVMRVKLSSTM